MIAAQFAAAVAATLSAGGSNQPQEPPAPPVVTNVPPPVEPIVNSVGREPQKVPPPAQVSAPAPPMPDVQQAPPSQPSVSQPHVATGAIQTHSVSLSNGDAPVSKSETANLETEKDTSVVDVESASMEVSLQNPAEPVSVSVKSLDRTSVTVMDSNTSNTRETTPEVHIVPPTPVDKASPDTPAELKSEAPSKSQEPATEVAGEWC